MKPRTRRLLLPVLLSLLAACTFERTPLAVAPSLETEAIDRILVLPVIDARPSPFEQVQVARNVGDSMVKFLRERGYVALSAEEFGERPAEPLDLRLATAEQLLPLAPADAAWFIVVQVERLEAKRDENGQVYEARLAAALVDRARVAVPWRDVAISSSNLSGMLSVLTRGTVQYEAAINASRALVESLPDRSPKGRRKR